jgi:mannosyltransferase
VRKGDEIPTGAARVGILVLTLAAFMLRAWQLDGQSLWRDEMDVIRFASWPLSQLVKSLSSPQHNGPVYYILMRGWLAVAGDSEFALRFVSLCSGVLAVPLSWRVAGRLVGRRAALMGALLIALSPYLVWYAQDGKMYAITCALTLLAMLCWWEALGSGRLRWWVGFVVATSLSLYIHMLSALMIPLYVLALALTWPRYRVRWRGWLTALCLLTLPYIPLAVWQLPLMVRTQQTGHAFTPLNEMVTMLVNLYSRGVAMTSGWPVLVAFLFALLMGLFGPDAPGAGRSWRARAFVLLWLLLPVGLIYLISLRVPIFEPRYLIFTAPPFYLLAGRGVIALARLTRPVSGALVAAMLAFSLLGVGVQAIYPIKSDFRSAAAYVKRHYQSGEPIMFQVPYVRYTFGYYFRTDYPILDGPWTNDGKSGASAAQLMNTTLAGYGNVWLVSSESWLWDQRGLARAWLDAHGQLIESASFALVDVYHYRLTGR